MCADVGSKHRSTSETPREAQSAVGLFLKRATYYLYHFLHDVGYVGSHGPALGVEDGAYELERFAFIVATWL
jgi:hypothetical protein